MGYLNLFSETCNISSDTFVSPYKTNKMNFFNRNKTVLLTSLFIICFLTVITVIAVSQSAAAPPGTNSCTLQNNCSSKMIWDDVAQGFLRVLAI